jgi:hypothetical protein
VVKFLRYVHLGATILSAILEYRIICSFEKTGVKVEMCKRRPDSSDRKKRLNFFGENGTGKILLLAHMSHFSPRAGGAASARRWRPTTAPPPGAQACLHIQL